MNNSTIKVLALLAIILFSCNEKKNGVADEQTLPVETRTSIEENDDKLDSIPDAAISNDFKGGGGEPFWSVAIKDKELHFQSPEENYKSIKTVIDMVNASGNTIMFHSTNNKVTIKVNLQEVECIDGMSGKRNTHIVKLSISEEAKNELKTYVGCGSFIIK